MKHATLIRIGLLVILIATIAVAVQYRESLDTEKLSATLEGFGVWAPVVFIALFALGTVAFLPGMVFALAGGLMFGPVLGTAYNLTGATIGAVMAFMAARYITSDWVRQKTGPRLDRIIRGVEEEGWRFAAFTRLVPLFPFNLLNYALGMTRIPLLQYTRATAVCMTPGALAFTYLGHAGGEAATVQSRIGELEFWRDRPVAVVCRTNKKSGKAAELLRAEGVNQILSSMMAWSGGRPTPSRQSSRKP